MDCIYWIFTSTAQGEHRNTVHAKRHSRVHKNKKRIATALGCIEGVFSDPDSPIVLVETNNPHAKQRILRDEGHVVGIHGSHLRLCINENCDNSDLRRIGHLLK